LWTSERAESSLAAKFSDRLLNATTCGTSMALLATTQEAIIVRDSSLAGACDNLAVEGTKIGTAKVPGADKVIDKAYLEWWIDRGALCNAEELAGHIAG
jgi:hypothetical protein